MKESSSYSLKELSKWHPLGEYRRRLMLRGETTRIVVNGDEIGLQMSFGPYTLLATQFDYFDGCHHWLYLLREDGKPIDQLRMPDEFGFIQEAVSISRNEVAFGFFGTNDRWNLVVTEAGFWSYAPWELLRRPNRFLLAKRHLLAKRTKGAPWSMPGQAPNPSSQRTGSAGR